MVCSVARPIEEHMVYPTQCVSYLNGYVNRVGDLEFGVDPIHIMRQAAMGDTVKVSIVEVP
jgi:hypothetical protein